MMRTFHPVPPLMLLLLATFPILAGCSTGYRIPVTGPLPANQALQTAPNTNTLYLPAVMNRSGWLAIPRVNAPYFSGSVPFNQMAIFWFGKVTASQNYSDVRVGYNANAIYVHVATMDRRLWCSSQPGSQGLTAWDSASLLIRTGAGGSPVFRFSDQLSGPSCPPHPAAEKNSGSGWVESSLAFTTTTTWRGNAPNDDTDDRGWTIDFTIPFSSLGLNSAPAQGSTWKLAVEVHDRHDAAGTITSTAGWPVDMSVSQPGAWGDLVFGLPTYSYPPVSPFQTVLIQNKLNGAAVVDGWAGGGTTCGDGLDFWNQWGDTSYPGSTNQDQFNIQNQGDIADWPCFSKYYVTFPLDSLPPRKVILSASLVLHQFGNSGGGQWGTPPSSLIQVFTVAQDISGTTLTWNSAPPAAENVSQAWVDPIPDFPGWPGVPRTWDVSRAVSQAYAAGSPLRLAMYSADEDYHTGKYFISSDTGDWDAAARPELQIVLGQP